MNLDEVEVGNKYKCDPGDGKQYYALVLEKDDWQVRVALGDALTGRSQAARSNALARSVGFGSSQIAFTTCDAA